jgi:hypothetical protein
VFFGAARYALVWLPWLALLTVQRGAESAGRPAAPRGWGRGPTDNATGT